MKTLSKITLLALLAGLGFFVYANYVNVCGQTQTYSIGAIDPRFGISADELARIVQETEGVWESHFETEFFAYDPESNFKINLIFDDRQQRTIDEKNSRQNISTAQNDYRMKVEQYETNLINHQNLNNTYDAAVAAYDQRLRNYNEQVDYWNQNGGAPSKEFNELQREKTALQREAKRLETERQSLNTLVIGLNVQAAEINALARNLNLDVDAYNGKFGTSREFDQGTYTGDTINIYQFNTTEDLRLVVAHELGHALGIEHIDDPDSVMYYLMDKQNIEDMKLTQADIDAVKSTCRIR